VDAHTDCIPAAHWTVGGESLCCLVCGGRGGSESRWGWGLEQSEVVAGSKASGSKPREEGKIKR